MMKCTVVKVWALILIGFGFASGSAFSQTTLVPLGSSWRFLDNGVDQGTSWRTAGFDDSTWSAGAAELGFGDNDEITRLSQTNGSGVTNLTFYFRHVFNTSAGGLT